MLTVPWESIPSKSAKLPNVPTTLLTLPCIKMCRIEGCTPSAEIKACNDELTNRFQTVEIPGRSPTMDILPYFTLPYFTLLYYLRPD